MTYLDMNEVQMFLDNLQPMESFAVIYTKKDGSQRTLVGTLDPNTQKRMDNVPVMCEEGWRSFNRHNVLWIGYPDQVELLMELMKKEVA